MPTVGQKTSYVMPSPSAAGQIVVKETTLDYNLRWASSRDGDFGGSDIDEFSGQWTDYRTFKSGVSPGLSVLGTNTWYMPFYNPRPLPITAVGGYLTTGTNATYAIGFSSVAANNQPGTLLASASGIPLAAGGFALPLAYTIPQGWWYVSFGAGTNASTYSVNADTVRPFTPVASGGFNYQASGPAWPSAWLGSTAAPVSNPAGSWQYVTAMPYVGFRIA